jgi:hypothetical protein
MNVAGKYCIMSENTAVKIGNIDLGSIAKQIDSKAQFKEASWEEHIDATLKGIRELKGEIVLALQEFQPEIGRGDKALGPDGPTDVIWIISLIFIIRTIGILGSKSTDNRRSEENKREHARLLEQYIEDVNTTIRQKENCIGLFPITSKKNPDP